MSYKMTDTMNGAILKTSRHGQRLRNYAEKKNQQYGSYRYHVEIISGASK